MGRPLPSFPCAINGALLLFLPFYFEFLSWIIFWNICLILSKSDCISTYCCGDVVRKVFIIDWFIFIWRLVEGSHLIDELLNFCHVQFYQPWHCWNLLFQMLVDYWDNRLLVGSWMDKKFHMFHWYLFFCARFWVFL